MEQGVYLGRVGGNYRYWTTEQIASLGQVAKVSFVWAMCFGANPGAAAYVANYQLAPTTWAAPQEVGFGVRTVPVRVGPPGVEAIGITSFLWEGRTP